MKIEEAKRLLKGQFEYMADSINHVLIELELKLDAKILDIGTGKGKMAIILALNGYTVTTGEPAEDHSEYAKKDWKSDAEKVGVDHLITFKPLSAQELPFEDESFDAIFMYGAFHHFNDKEASLKECLRVTRPNGIVCIIEPNNKVIETIQKRFPSHPDGDDPRNYLNDSKVKVEVKNNSKVDTYILKRN
ncbi:MAG: class I SAM-dependent methyltransferase [Promethearchaeota archaeon]|nr:MAG: class I SAM-dependent methyltransferase [Candidatus Lokiarchaeota archaeon]